MEPPVLFDVLSKEIPKISMLSKSMKTKDSKPKTKWIYLYGYSTPISSISMMCIKMKELSLLSSNI